MRVGVKLRAKEEFHERIGITDTHGVYEHVARAEHQSFEDNCNRGKSLPKHGEARVILRFEPFPATWKLDKCQPYWTYLQPEAVFNMLKNRHRLLVRPRVYDDIEVIELALLYGLYGLV